MNVGSACCHSAQDLSSSSWSPKLFIHLAVCLTTGPKPLPKPALHIVRSRDSSFNWQYPLLYLKSSSSFLRLLPRLLATSIPPFIFPSITRCRRQFLRKMGPIQLAFRLLISCRILLCSLTLSNGWNAFHPVLSQSVHGTATYRCDDTRECIIKFCRPDDEHMCSKHVEASKKLIIKFSASSWLILRNKGTKCVRKGIR